MAVVDQQAMMEVTSDAPVSELVIPDTSEVVDQPMASPKISSNPASTIVKINLKSASPNALTTEQKDSIKHSSGVNGVTDEQRLIKSSQSDIEDIFEDDSELSQQKHPCAIFRPQLDDIMLDQDLLDLYEQLKFLVSLSPLKTAQVLFAFSSATDHLALELEVRKSALDMNKKAFTFYQDNTWFAVDLEPPLDISDDEAYESDPKFKILPARHALFPAFQRQKPWDPTPSSHLPHHYYYPYPYPYEHPLPAQYPAESGVFSEQRRSRDRERHYRSYRHGTKSSKRRSSRDLESSPQRLPGSMHDGRLLKRSRHDIDSPSLPSGDTAGRYSMEPESPTASREAEPRHRIKDGDNDGDDDDQQRKLSRIERRLARKKLKQANKLRLQREAEEQRLASGETSKEKDGTESGSSVIVRGRPFKITLVQSGKPLSSTLGQSSSGDSAGFDRPKPLHGWIPPSEQGDNENSGQPGAPSQRSIRPNSESQTSGVEGDAGSKGQSQKPGAINTQVMGRKSKNIQATPIQATGSSGSQSPHVGSGGPLYTDKSEDKLKKGTWTSQEEEILLEAVRDLSSENWHAVAMKVPGRNAKQCMQKWQTDLDPRINRQPWTAEEDEKLVEAYHTFGNSWQQIAKMVETRTWYQCYNRVRAKSVKTKIMMTAGSHPASLANTGGRTSSNSLDGSKAGSKDMEPKKPAKEAQGRGATSSPTTVESRAKTDAGQISTQNSSSSSDKPIQDSPAVTSGGSQYQQLASVPARQQDTIVSDERASSPKAQPPSQSHQQSQHQSPRDQQQPQQPQPQQSPQSQQPQQPQTQPPPQPQHVHHNQQHQHPSQTSHPHEQQSSVHQVKAPSSDAAAYWPKPVSS
ncbi:hypothetical protein BX616_004128 [Lobosporangium transversale]|nr:hypothetical protein BX616_004128 [Lobosporangium transversale]